MGKWKLKDTEAKSGHNMVNYAVCGYCVITGFCNMRLKEEFVIGADQSSHTSFGKKKRNQQHSLVEDEFKVVKKHPTGDVRDAQTDELHSGGIKRYQPP